ncbi:bestrophin-like domain [Zavarzinella formosa]|uniref:bestrophin-like domain n=1 Tax=Zavarzinella formosa TaxID=360055 RepID=UPI0002F6380D|nr:hypothetical protein [Zavarzinella formosa]
MSDLIRNEPTWLLISIMLAAMTISNVIGYVVGKRHRFGESEPSRNVSNMLKGSVFGLVALLMGFSFSMTVSRHDNRRKVVLSEANAIGTCYLRAGLLPPSDRDRIRETLRRYVSVRLEFYEKGIDPAENRQATQEMGRLLDELWERVEAAVKANQQTALTSQIVPATNEMIDLDGTRAWADDSHLPMPILGLLVACVIVSCLLMGHSSGQAGKCHAGLWLSLNVLMALVLFVILDFDRPRRGLVRVNHEPLIKLQASIQPSGK